MYRMLDTVIYEICEHVIARVEAIGKDMRSEKQEELTLYFELPSQDQNVKPIVERVLEKMGYQYMGISNVLTTNFCANADNLWDEGKKQEM